MNRCKSCIVGKLHQNTYKRRDSSEHLSPLDLVMADVWGPAPLTSENGCRFYVLFIDKASRFNWIFPVERKSQVLDIFRQFKKDVELKFDKKIRALQTDNGGEFLGLKSFLLEHGIVHRCSCPHTPANGSGGMASLPRG